MDQGRKIVVPCIGVKEIVVSLCEPSRTIVVKETGQRYDLIITRNNKVMLQASK